MAASTKARASAEAQQQRAGLHRPSNRAASSRAYGWLLDYVPESPSIFDHGHFLSFTVSELIFAVVLASPPVVAATGVSALRASALVAAHFFGKIA